MSLVITRFPGLPGEVCRSSHTISPRSKIVSMSRVQVSLSWVTRLLFHPCSVSRLIPSRNTLQSSSLSPLSAFDLFNMKFDDCSVAVRLLFLLLPISPLRVVLASDHQQPLFKSDNELTGSSRSWNFNFSSTAPHFFASIYGLMQQWPNTFFPNGHSIAPCEIAAFTKLYHGRTDGDVPPSPEWFAFDMSVFFHDDFWGK